MHNDTIIKVVDSDFITSNWNDIEQALLRSFEYSDFNKGYSLETVLFEVQKYSIKNKNALNVVALKNERIIGSIFSIIPNENSSDIYYDIGWLFTDSTLTKKEKVSVAIAMVEQVHNLIRKMKYKYIYTEIGTKQGISLLSKKFNYTRIENSRYWVKEL